MTIRLFDENPYLINCTSNIINMEKNNDDILITLDKTIFFPESGGQLSDKGWINDAKVLQVFEKDNIIYHKVDKDIPISTVECKLDWVVRLDRMQQHCGEHILSGVFLSLYNSRNHGFHMGEDYVTIDMDLKTISNEMIEKVEDAANKIIFNNNPIHFDIVDKSKADSLPLRKELKVDSNIRIVTIENVDCVACCGTHPNGTAEVGLIKIIKAEKYKSMTRVYFNCGLRALRDYQNKSKIVNDLCTIYSTDENSIKSKALSQSEKIKELSQELKKIKNLLLKDEATEILKNISYNSSIKNDLEEFPITKVFLQDKSFEDIQSLASFIMEDKKTVVFIASEKDKKILLAHDGTFNLHCGKIYKNTIKEYNGRGGGGDKIAQGSFESVDDLKNFFENIF
ncbi:alanyl-tRNA editing protein [Clostridium grantii]|uniref:Alanyl-tRNA synthetase n=1 Tax=Clostridium grantii DSM 8605 TaxID=1121316 RepID=A0A1M5UDA1_9CLOT|nr:DHHA1 domain-containing protein [Clostridium grantii]SHH60920.1 alanyl-tRNA synthetase [Clostridium grantii DSM 8605]